MTIHEGICEAFRRLGATENRIEAVLLETDRIFPLVGADAKDEQVPIGWEEDFINAYMKFTVFICKDGPMREHLEEQLKTYVAKN